MVTMMTMMMMMMTMMYKISTSSESTGPRSTSASSPGSGESEQLDNKVRSQIRSSESYPNTRQNYVTSNIFITNSFCFSVGLHPSPTTPHLLIPQQMGAAPLIGLLMPPLLGCTCTCTTTHPLQSSISGQDALLEKPSLPLEAALRSPCQTRRKN